MFLPALSPQLMQDFSPSKDTFNILWDFQMSLIHARKKI